ncbi:hypothetical protein [Arachnia propionica]|uniref:hypothetical protein n=1 Tax=Arachnia propionica TaxID=1750 RepID=UPI0021AB4267|nr:hypothetical protein [Arachnia propionica]
MIIASVVVVAVAPVSLVTRSVIFPTVEHCIAHLKNWKILAKGYRGRLKELPAIIRIVTQLELLRTQ